MAKNREEEPLQALYEKTDRMSEMYGNDPYWQAMKVGVDAARVGSVTQEILDRVAQEHRCWGPATTNKVALRTLLERLKGCAVVDVMEETVEVTEGE